MQLVPLVLFVAVHLKNCFLLPSCHLTLMSFCTQVLPGIAESIFSKSEKTFSWEKVTFSGGREVNFWMMDSATSLFGSAQNDRGGGKLRRVKVFGLNKPTKRKSGAMCMS